MHRFRTRLLAALAAIIVVGSGVTGIASASASSASQDAAAGQVAKAALSGADFNPNLIISDSKFFAKDAMTEAQIQDFLNGKVANCTAGYTCLKAYVESTPDRAASICAAYPGAGNESAARIIFKVAQACGVNPQVLLVTLQKENSLVTSTRPSAGAYRTAMGYGCPDTAACDTQYFGFFNQVYNAARQFIRYGLPGNTFRYKVGNVAVQFHPNAACGSTVLNIRSQGTANLYNYTPYQPNAAAMANLSGTGDACSSYGNRNFWVFYNTWFGSPVDSGQEQIAQYYAAAGGASGWLGPVVGSIQSSAASGGGLSQAFQNGTVFWSLGAGPKVVTGPMLSTYLARGDAASGLGWPTSDTTSVTGGGLTGQIQSFQNGNMVVNANGSWTIAGITRDAYTQAGGPAGVLGWPTMEPLSSPVRGGGYVQRFDGGSIYASNVSGGYVLRGEMLAGYIANGSQTGPLGWPVSNGYDLTVGGGGKSQGFQAGSLYWSTGTGAHAVFEPMRAIYWAALGEGGYLSWPTTDISYPTANGGGAKQSFLGGSIYSSPAGSFILSGSMLSAYVSLGGESGALGWPASGLFTVPANGGGYAQGFQFGSFYSSVAGTYAVRGGIRDFYWGLAGEGGSLGWPTAPEQCGLADGGCSQSFQNGTVFWSPSEGARVGSIPEIDAERIRVASQLGKALTGILTVSSNGGGKAQGFQRGSIYFSPTYGAFAVLEPIRAAYWAVAGETGVLGWPTGRATAISANGGGTTQPFMGGVIYSSGSGTHVLSGPMLTTFTSLGGPAGSLGWPASPLFTISANGGGTAQGFQSASLYSSSAGTFAVAGATRAFYWSTLGEGGPLGWPTGAETCDGNGVCSQPFQGGTIISGAGNTAHVALTPEIDAVYTQMGGATGSLGKIASPLFTITANGGGKAQGFEFGSIYYTPSAGAFAVVGPIRAFYWSKLGEGGALGWPTAPESCDSAHKNCTQTFQNGTIVWSSTGGASLG